MGYECLGCHQAFDQKGTHSRHTARCNKFKQEARKRRTNYGLAISAPPVANPPEAGGSNYAGMLHEEVVEAEQLMQPGSTTVDDVMVSLIT